MFTSAHSSIVSYNRGIVDNKSLPVHRNYSTTSIATYTYSRVRYRYISVDTLAICIIVYRKLFNIPISQVNFLSLI